MAAREPTDDIVGGVVDPRLAETMRHFLGEPVSPGTADSYRSSERLYLALATSEGWSRVRVLRPRVQQAAGFIAFMVNRGLAPTTRPGYISAVKSFIRRSGGSARAFNDMRVRKMLVSVKRLVPHTVRRRDPLTIFDVRTLIGHLDFKSSVQGLAMATILSLGVCALFRVGELCWTRSSSKGRPIVRRSDVKVERHRVTVTLRWSKSAGARSTDVHIYRSEKGASPVLRPYEMALRMLRKAPLRGADDPFVQNADGRCPRYENVHERLRALVRKYTSIDPMSIGTHSLRQGGATSLRMLGVDARVIMAVGRWKTEASYLLYSRAASQDIRAASAALTSGSTWVPVSLGESAAVGSGPRHQLTWPERL
jgi:hypothetical protein